MVRAAVAPSALVLCTAPALAGSHSCSGRARPLSGNRCSDGSIPVYQANPITPYTSGSQRAQGGRTIQPYRGGGTIHVFTPEERARMNENNRRVRHDIAQRWTRGGRALNGAQLNAIQNQRCLLMAAGNPDVRCVPR